MAFRFSPQKRTYTRHPRDTRDLAFNREFDASFNRGLLTLLDINARARRSTPRRVCERAYFPPIIGAELALSPVDSRGFERGGRNYLEICPGKMSAAVIASAAALDILLD